MLNLIVAIFLAAGNDTDQCIWYFVNILVDTTFGVFLCYCFMIIIDRIARIKNWKVTIINSDASIWFIF
jgi:hypothetical protein